MILFFLAGILLLPITAHAQTNKICQAGEKACLPLLRVSAKYNRCMQIICARASKKTQSTKRKILQCEKGYKRCNILRDNPLQYWTCVDDTCRNPPRFELESTCTFGHRECKPKLTNYWQCMSKVCNTPYDEFQSCTAGTTQCTPSLSNYWDCVHEKCLGSVNKYRNPTYYTNKVKAAPVYQFLTSKETKDIPASYIAPLLTSVPARFRYAPKGVNPYDWNASTPAPARLIIGSVTNDFYCQNPRASLSCISRDVSSCVCSDGGRPLSKQHKKDSRANKATYDRSKNSKFRDRPIY